MESSSRSNPSSRESSGYMLTPIKFAQWRRTLDKLTGGRMPTSRFNFSHSVSLGLSIFKLSLLGKGTITGVLCPWDKTEHAMVSNTSRHSLGIVPVRGKSTSCRNLCLVMCTTPFIPLYERRLLQTLLAEWLRLSGGWQVDISRVRFSNARR